MPELFTATEEQKAAMKANQTHVVSRGLFMENPLPYLELRRPMWLGIHDRVYKPSLSH